MSTPREGALPRATATVKFSLAAPASFTPQRKYGPVVAPKPKVNPFRTPAAGALQPESKAAAETGGSAAPQDLSRTTKVEGVSKMAPEPPPPSAEDVLPAPSDLPLPPPPPSPPLPPPPFEESFPPPPLDDAFPSPPSPMVEEALLPGQKTVATVTAPQSGLASVETSLEKELDNLTSLLHDMERQEPRRAMVEDTAPSGSIQPGPSQTPGTKMGLRAPGCPPVTAPKPQAPLPKAQVTPKATTPVLREQEGVRQTTRMRESPETSTGGDRASPLSYRDVQELESLAQNLIREMDRHPAVKAGTAESCGRCGKELSRSQAAVKAMGQMFHVECFACAQCGRQLQGQQFYEVGGEPLCQDCHQETLEKCGACGQPIQEKLLRATGKPFHPECFTCADCGRRLEGTPFLVDPECKVYCVEDYHRRFAPRCSVCQHPIIPEEGREETVRIVALERNFHLNCYRCEDCGTQLSTDADEKGCYPLDGHILCLACHSSRLKSPQP